MTSESHSSLSGSRDSDQIFFMLGRRGARLHFALSHFMGRKNLWSYNFSNQRKMEDVKKQMCRAIRKAARKKNYSRREWALYMGTSKAIVSSIENERVHRLSFNQLFRYLVYLEPNFELLISI
jgi:hypothetical protein